MQQVINFLVERIGSVDSVEQHINLAIASRRGAGVDGVIDYVDMQLGHLLNLDQKVTFAQSILDLDAAIVSVNL